MAVLHLENLVPDYGTWKAAFDRFDRVRAEHGVRGYRVSRRLDDPHRILVDLDFDTVAQAQSFVHVLERIWQTPQSQRILAGHGAPVVLETLDAGVPAGRS